MLLRVLFTALIALPLISAGTLAADEVVNVYSARHYDTDDVLYDDFTKQTGIEVRVIEGGSDELLERLKREGSRSPADVFITVDAGRLFKAEEQGLFQSVESEELTERVPEHLRHPEGKWFGLTERVRAIYIPKDRVRVGEITTYEQLADDEWRDRVLIRSSSNVYNQSLVGSLIAAHGEQRVEQWAEGVVENMARRPQGGDTDQLRALAAGEGDVAVANHYYYARMLTSDDADDRAAAAKLQLVFPNQEGRGAHVNISGAGVVKHAPNKKNAVKFLEYLASDKAQQIFAAGNQEFPVVEGIEISPVLKQFGEFKEDKVSAHEFGQNNEKAIRVMDRAGWR